MVGYVFAPLVRSVLVAQPEERRPPKPQAAGSTPAGDAIADRVVDDDVFDDDDVVNNAAPKAQVAEFPPGTREMAGASPARGSRANAVGTTSATNRVVAGATSLRSVGVNVLVQLRGLTSAPPCTRTTTTNPALHPIHGEGSSVVEHVRVSALLVARFLVTDPEEVEGPGCDPGARRFESARSPQPPVV